VWQELGLRLTFAFRKSKSQAKILRVLRFPVANA